MKIVCKRCEGENITKNCTFYTDDWDTFAKILPPGRHIVGKIHTQRIESNNSNTRHHLARMTRRTKVVSKCEKMLNATIKLWVVLQDKNSFLHYQKTALSIFK